MVLLKTILFVILLSYMPLSFQTSEANIINSYEEASFSALKETYFYAEPYIKDTISLSEGCVIDFSNMTSFPVFILNITTKESVAIESMPASKSYEIEKGGNYMVLCIKNGCLVCINDTLTIEYPCPEAGSEFRLL